MSHTSDQNLAHNKTQLLGLLYAFLGFSCFALGDTGYKWLMQDYSFFMMLFWASITAVTLMSLYIPFGGGVSILKTAVPKLQFARTLVISAQFLLSIYSIQYLPLPLFYTIAFMAPSISAILGLVFLKEPVSKANWIAIAVGLSGVCVALKPWSSFFGDGFDYNIWAIFGIMSSAAFLSVSQILARMIGKKSQDSGFTTAFYPIFLVMIISGVLHFTSADPVSIGVLKTHELILVCLIALGGIGGNVLLAIGFAKAPPALAAPFHYTQIIWAFSFGYFLFGDTIDKPMILGAFLVIGSGIYLVTHKVHAAKQVEDEPTITQI